MHDKLPQLQPDYLISWDFSDKDLPAVVVTRIRREGHQVMGDVLGVTHETTGCVSLRQVLEDYENRQREEKERDAAMMERLKNWDVPAEEGADG